MEFHQCMYKVYPLYINKNSFPIGNLQQIHKTLQLKYYSTLILSSMHSAYKCKMHQLIRLAKKIKKTAVP